MEPKIRFCDSADGIRLAYATAGTGRPVVVISGWGSTLEHEWQCELGGSTFVEEFARRCTLMYIDRRGLGASEREPHDVSLKAQVQDIEAVAVCARWDVFDIVAMLDGCLVAIGYAHAYPERVRNLILWAPYASASSFMRPEATEALKGLIRANWGMARRALSQAVFPSGPTDQQLHTAEAFRDAVLPEIAAKYVDFQMGTDVGGLLRSITQPTLVLHERGDRTTPIAEGRAVAASIPNAEFVVLEGDHSVPYLHESALPLIWEFIGVPLSVADEAQSSSKSATMSQMGTAVILFADIVDSTVLTERLGDTPFREKARALDTALRAIIRESGGTPVEGKLLGDGVLAVFTSARQAIEAALKCGAAGDEGGLPLHLGLHAGDVIEEDGNVFGGAVNIAARIAAESAPGELLVSQTVRDLARTSANVTFENAGERPLKGVSEPVRLWRVAPAI